jgi:hypothetical protein
MVMCTASKVIFIYAKLHDMSYHLQCYPLVDPYPYVAACQYDRCHSTNKQSSSCRDLEAYARACMQAGLCLNWRTNASCPYTCPEGKAAVMQIHDNAREI